MLFKCATSICGSKKIKPNARQDYRPAWSGNIGLHQDSSPTPNFSRWQLNIIAPLRWQNKRHERSIFCQPIEPESIPVSGTILPRFHINMGLSSSLNGKTPIKFVNTSMHGVSDPFVTQAFASFGFAPYIPVVEQQQPDPEFPSVKFPNPEEKGQYLYISLPSGSYSVWLGALVRTILLERTWWSSHST